MSNQREHSSKSKRFSKEDYLRVSRLREEIVARITEISLIMGRTLEVAPPSVIREFVLTDGPDAEPLEMSVLKTSAPNPDPVTGTVEIITWGCACPAQLICCADPECPPCH